MFCLFDLVSKATSRKHRSKDMQVNSGKGRQQIALYGGAFDPVHNAHLHLALSALEQAGMDRVCFIPAAQSPLKEHGTIARDAQRLEMLKLATEDEPRFVLSDYEIRKGGVSYSYQTVEYFKQLYPEARLYWILGADQFELLERWRKIERLAALAEFLVFARPGHSLTPPAIPDLKFQQIDAPLMAESSSLLRERRQAGKSISTMVPEAVEAFISEHELYK